MNKFSALLLTTALALTSACSRSSDVRQPAYPAVPEVTGPAIDPQNPPTSVKLSNGAEIELQKFGGRVYFTVEGTFAEASFTRIMAAHATQPESERHAAIKAEMDGAIRTLRGLKVLSLSASEAVGYFTFMLPYRQDLMAPLKTVRLDHSFLFNPVAVDRESLKQIRAFTPASEGLALNSSSARGDLSAFSGLKRIGVTEFVRQAQTDIGGEAAVNGDQVRLGISDTGITYNHPTFASADGKSNRVRYMKDFTREGRVYFNAAAAFRATAVVDNDAAVAVNADVILTPRLPNLPAGDQFTAVKDLKLLVSAELKKQLLDPASQARLGVLLEDSLQSDDEEIDLNANGKINDRFWMIQIPGATPEQDVVYFDASGTGDFRRATGLSDWNTSGKSMAVFAEKIGFAVSADKLPKADGAGEIDLRGVSIVGFDPGNHGTHVAGIAAGLKTIANDDPNTLARGVAPAASVLMNRVCANNGGCNATQAIIDLATVGKADVINMSLGGLGLFNDGFGVQETVVNRLTVRNNVLFVISAGNSGPGKQTVGSPSTARLSLSVGAAASVGMIQRQYQWPAAGALRAPEDDSDFMLFFSSRGPTAAGGFKPNLAAPGTELSSVRLNTAPGTRGGMDVYWGTSMAAPTATGAYALLLDAIRKYNTAHPDQTLATNALTLRRVLIESARPFGQYTWIDQGTGMLDLPSAWKKLFVLRDEEPAPAVQLASSTPAAPVELEYSVLIPTKNPNGLAYDGSRPASQGGDPTFGTGLYIDAFASDTLRPVYIQRKLPESLAASEFAGDLTRQLLTTGDEFVLKTSISGSATSWLSVGGLDQLNCAGSETANLLVLGRGVDVAVNADGTGTINPFGASVLNVCLDRAKIAALPPGDHGALISAYRTAGGKVSSVASFQVPVYLQVPHQTLSGSNGYRVEGEVKSFDVSRNYVRIPAGTSLVQITLEVAPVKRDARGNVAEGESCAGVELMGLQGSNTSPLFPSRLEARVANCDAKGRPVEGDSGRVIRFSQANPSAGTWDLHVFGQYRFARSKYVMRVDYVTASASVKEITGTPAALSGTIDWNVQEASFAVAPSAQKSRFELDSLYAETKAQVSKDATVIVVGPLGSLRQYPANTQAVTITTGGSPGNDIDLTVLECDATAKNLDDPSCTRAGASGGATDEESVRFVPAEGKAYAVRVDGYDVKDSGAFLSTERITLRDEAGAVTVTGTAPNFRVGYAFSAVATSPLLNHERFKSGDYAVAGSLTLRTAEGVTLFSVPVLITNH